jgi:hypothetical protein
MTDKPMTRNEKVQEAAFSLLLGLILLGLLSGISACVVWSRL